LPAFARFLPKPYRPSDPTTEIMKLLDQTRRAKPDPVHTVLIDDGIQKS
jgi:hypothetical protein